MMISMLINVQPLFYVNSTQKARSAFSWFLIWPLDHQISAKINIFFHIFLNQLRKSGHSSEKRGKLGIIRSLCCWEDLRLSTEPLLVQIGGHLAEEIGVYQWTSVSDHYLSTVLKYGFTGFIIIDFVQYNGRHLTVGERRKLIAPRLVYTTHNSVASPICLYRSWKFELCSLKLSTLGCR